MNNYGSPYFMNPYSYQSYGQNQNQMQQMQQMQQVQPQYQQYQQPMQQVQQVQQAPINNQINYDFSGSYVKSYEEAKSAPYTDKPVMYLDLENDKLYIKRINEKGTPQTDVYSVVEAESDKKDNKSKSVEVQKNNFDEKLNSAIQNIKNEYDKKISALENQISEFKNKRG